MKTVEQYENELLRELLTCDKRTRGKGNYNPHTITIAGRSSLREAELLITIRLPKKIKQCIDQVAIENRTTWTDIVIDGIIKVLVDNYRKSQNGVRP